MAEYPDRSSESRRTAGVRGWGWWFGQLLLTVIAGFFVCFGIAVLAAAYDLNDPFSFVMTFFAASLIILISLVMVMAFV
ncbi:MAG TPA: hypothetical protein VLT88_01545, partial [Desulfosarcina sp.]|nr:hypothetical protein [Desulfosarcina sp.]